ncbi:hypothetical protein EDD52_11026 [Primorskyibacter sedentarius]|uniref:Glycosyl transferase family 2 n=1 Tax=Primorskyibacter sedentarius TaxID=745311 RepID=A0A4R3J8M3_9RHOB|nr:hypothetical protein [Primorskyibacter sedentarius]TCS61852.1 hypothetical protein EDD52_11026 [Primorskyibacter sedentarius]
MTHPALGDFLRQNKAALSKGPVALIFVEDDVEIESSLRHHLSMGFAAVVAFMRDGTVLPSDLGDKVFRVSYDMTADNALTDAVNAVIAAVPGTWIYYCYNAEYLFFPFCETRTIGEMLAFHTEERRDAMLCYVVDLYAGDLDRCPNAISLEDAWLDKSGYYALARRDAPEADSKQRQLDFFGGLRWRYEEHVPVDRRRIDRIAIFRAKPGLKLREDHTFSIEEYNTYSCPWHHNLTSAVASFRTAKALKRNPGSTYDIPSFRWHNSTPFEWHSRQLLDLGLMEPGQWF